MPPLGHEIKEECQTVSSFQYDLQSSSFIN